jgi:hypothetical protein
MMLGGLPWGISKTGERNYHELHDVPFGRDCMVMRKRDGYSCSFYYCLKNDRFGVLSRTHELKQDANHVFVQHVKQYNIENQMRQYCQTHKTSLCVRGESFGGGLRKQAANEDSKKGSRWEVFGAWDIENNKRINIRQPHNSISLSQDCGFNHVPILEWQALLTPKLINHYENEEIGFEGVVVHCGESSFKILNQPYYAKLNPLS